MKRLLTILLLFIMCFSFVACDTKTEPAPSPSPDYSDTIIIPPSEDKTAPDDNITIIPSPSEDETPLPEKPKRPESEILVIITPSGKKYHAGNCQYVNDNPNISYKYLDVAKQEGYTACSKCEQVIENELLK